MLCYWPYVLHTNYQYSSQLLAGCKELFITESVDYTEAVCID